MLSAEPTSPDIIVRSGGEEAAGWRPASSPPLTIVMSDVGRGACYLCGNI